MVNEYRLGTQIIEIINIEAHQTPGGTAGGLFFAPQMFRTQAHTGKKL